MCSLLGTHHLMASQRVLTHVPFSLNGDLFFCFPGNLSLLMLTCEGFYLSEICVNDDGITQILFLFFLNKNLFIYFG